jgi:hypothetical protein
MQRWIVNALAALAAGASAEERERPDPADPRTSVPVVEYRSAFEGYRRFAEQKLAPWRESNTPREEPAPGQGHESHGSHR